MSLYQINTIDLLFQNKPEVVASYLIQTEHGYLLVDTGPMSTLPTLLAQLETYRLKPTDISAILLTHIHFDHAGAAGWWSQQSVPIYVHPIGLPHLVDPTRLIRSATRIYKEDMDRLWGTFVPANPNYLHPVVDKEQLHLIGLTITALETPGHATHHIAYQIDDIAFTGDIAGVQLPNVGWIDLPAPPPEFNVADWKKSIIRLQAAELTAIYPTHFGRHEQVATQLATLENTLDAAVTFVAKRLKKGIKREEIITDYLFWIKEEARTAGISELIADRYEAANPHFMSVDGIIRYCQKVLGII